MNGIFLRTCAVEKVPDEIKSTKPRTLMRPSTLKILSLQLIWHCTLTEFQEKYTDRTVENI